MNFSRKRFLALVVKESKDIKTNSNVILMILITMFFAVFYGRIIGRAININEMKYVAGLTSMYLCISLVSFCNSSILIAEEKEKNTFKVLMLSPVTEFEIILAKGFLIFIISLLVCIICNFISGASVGNIFIYILNISLSEVFCIILGMIVGLISKDEKQTAVTGVPLLVFLILPMMFAYEGLQTFIIKKVIKFVPTYYSGKIYNANLKNLPFSFMYKDFIVLVISLVVALMLFFIVYKKHRLFKN